MLAVEAVRVQIDHLEEAAGEKFIEYKTSRHILCLNQWSPVSGSSSTPFASSARPRKYLSPSGTAPNPYQGGVLDVRFRNWRVLAKRLHFRLFLRHNFVHELV